MTSPLILPGDPEFYETLGHPPPGWQQVAAACNDGIALIARAGSGILEAVSWDEAEEYLEGGEYDERLEELGENEPYYTGP